MNIFGEILSVATIELVFVIVVFKLILSNYKPPIQESLQALACVCIGIALALLMKFTVESFMLGVICSGLGFYGGTYVNEIRGINDNIGKKATVEEDEEDANE